MAAVGVMLMAPLAGLFSQMSGQPDFCEVACSPTSALCSEMERRGYTTKRYNYKNGYDLEKGIGTRMFNQDVKMHPPRAMWVSLPCTRLSSLVHLTERSPEEWARFEKRQQQDLRRAEEIADGVITTVENGGHFGWEWPTGAKKGWDSRAIRKIQRRMREMHKPLFWCTVDGCAYGLEFKGFPVKKSWTIMTSDKNLWLSLQKRCPGHSDHVHCRGVVAQASAYYPQAMVRAVVQAFTQTWRQSEENHNISMAKDVETYLLEIPGTEEDHNVEKSLREEDPTIFALSRNRFPEEPPKGRQLENIRQQMLRIHRASGHSSFTNLQRLLRMRKAPTWAIEMAGKMTCPDCVEAQKPRPHPPAALGDHPGLYEIVGTDIFEYEHQQRKFKFIIWRDRASGLVMVEELQSYGGPDDESSSWEPTTKDIIRSFTRWLLHNPSPAWVISDPATYYTSQEFLQFMGNSGIGVLTIPAESHWMLGGEEGAISVLKMAATRLLKSEEDLTVGQAFELAAHGHNQTIGSTGFSPFQWTRGSSCPQGQLPAGINPSKAFGGAFKMREKGRIAYEAENAKYKMSKLSNAVTRPPVSFKTGTLLMLWRQRMKPGKVSGQWTGPVRVLVQEGKTVWLATGATIIKARTTQLRACTKREELQATLEGTTIYKTPVTIETLLQSFTGRHFLNVTGEAPSLRQMQQDVQGAEVAVESRPPASRSDTWRLDEQGSVRWLVRVHEAPRLALFNPEKIASVPIDLDDLTGKRKTIIRPVIAGSSETTLEDNFKDSSDPSRSLQERWTGETWLEIKPMDRPPKMSKKNPKRGQKRETATEDAEDVQREDDDEEPEEQEEKKQKTEGRALPEVPDIHPLTTALRERGAEAVDGVPASSSKPFSITGYQCVVPQCVLPGGHAQHHEDADGNPFSWTPYGGRVNLEETPSSSSSSSTASEASSEEMIADAPEGQREKRKETAPTKNKDAKKRKEKDYMVALEIEVTPEDAKHFLSHPRKAAIWLSKRMEAKSKEHSWRKMDLEQKKDFDLAQARELTNVLQSKALRTLTREEWARVDRAKIMGMRWVLTTKSDGSSKARLVILGYQAWNLVEVQSSAPTMSRLSRNLVLTTCANHKFRLRSGDVTSAFLQTQADMSSEELYVWAPSELAVLFGADPEYPVLPLKVVRAFYGLSHAPRKWFEQVVATLGKLGWRQLTADRCVFTMYEGEELIGICGIHVDDFLIGGLENHPRYIQAKTELEQSFRWGRWDEGSFTFAGCEISQGSDFSIRITQENYTDQWLEEINIDAQRKTQVKAQATVEEISQLRGVIGTMAWRASQTSPHYMADAGLLLSEIPKATVQTLLTANKIVREMKRESSQSLLFPSWGVDWKEMATVVWADASQKNRHDGSSTMGILAGIAPAGILTGDEIQVALVHWRSSKTPRQCLGSNGAEVQAITEGEDLCFRVRALWAEIHGMIPNRYSMIKCVI